MNQLFGANFLSCLRRKSLLRQNDSDDDYDDDDDDDDDDLKWKLFFIFVKDNFQMRKKIK